MSGTSSAGREVHEQWLAHGQVLLAWPPRSAEFEAAKSFTVPVA
jgi:hypothetical protein